jgi:hypothetical protein
VKDGMSQEVGREHECPQWKGGNLRYLGLQSPGVVPSEPLLGPGNGGGKGQRNFPNSHKIPRLARHVNHPIVKLWKSHKPARCSPSSMERWDKDSAWILQNQLYI